MSEIQRARELVRAARLYAITPDAEPDHLEVLVRAWLAAGVRLVQLRQKVMPRGDLLELARRLGRVVAASGGALVVDDHADVAVLAGAAGVHVGPDDLSVAAVRKAVGGSLLVGASAPTPEAAQAAVAAGADYVGSGPAYATATKPSKEVIGPAGIARVAAAVEVPVFAIGGVTSDRIGELRAVGLDRVCAISALDGPDPAARAGAMLRALE